MSNLRPPKTPAFFRVIDILMIPIMLILGGFKTDSIQETHPWHSFRDFDPKDINTDLSVLSAGTDSKMLKRHFLFLFHAPLLGGWRDYLVIAPVEPMATLHVGWIVRNTQTNALIEHGIQKLPVTNGAIRVLTGPPINTVHFFIVDKNGTQVAAQTVGEGTLGDHRFPAIRLF